MSETKAVDTPSTPEPPRPSEAAKAGEARQPGEAREAGEARQGREAERAQEARGDSSRTPGPPPPPEARKARPTAEIARAVRSGRDSSRMPEAPRTTGPAQADGGRAAAVPGATPGVDEQGRLGRRMDQAVIGFVDDPRRSVREADAVLDEVAARLTRVVDERRAALRAGSADGAGTEELRVALTRYRDLTQHLLAL